MEVKLKDIWDRYSWNRKQSFEIPYYKRSFGDGDITSNLKEVLLCNVGGNCLG